MAKWQEIGCSFCSLTLEFGKERARDNCQIESKLKIIWSWTCKKMGQLKMSGYHRKAHFLLFEIISSDHKSCKNWQFHRPKSLIIMPAKWGPKSACSGWRRLPKFNFIKQRPFRIWKIPSTPIFFIYEWFLKILSVFYKRLVGFAELHADFCSLALSFPN